MTRHVTEEHSIDIMEWGLDHGAYTLNVGIVEMTRGNVETMVRPTIGLRLMNG